MKQVPRAWNTKLDSTLISLDFDKSLFEHAVYKKNKGNVRILVGVYVDDLIITGNCATAIENFKQQMKKSFKMSDMGLLKYYLGIEVDQSSHDISICQIAYYRKLECQSAIPLKHLFFFLISKSHLNTYGGTTKIK